MSPTGTVSVLTEQRNMDVFIVETISVGFPFSSKQLLFHALKTAMLLISYKGYMCMFSDYLNGSSRAWY